MSAAFAERRLEAEGAPVRCLERGTGETVIALHDEPGTAPSPFEERLADAFHVVVLESSGFAALAPQDGARLLARAAALLGLGTYALVAGGRAAAAALWHAAEAAAPPATLVLLSPADCPDGTAEFLSDIKAPTLVLTGTKDEPATEEAGRRIGERVPECYPMLVYDTGPAMASERPDAVFEAVADFLERRGRFVLERQTSVISP